MNRTASLPASHPSSGASSRVFLTHLVCSPCCLPPMDSHLSLIVGLGLRGRSLANPDPVDGQEQENPRAPDCRSDHPEDSSLAGYCGAGQLRGRKRLGMMKLQSMQPQRSKQHNRRKLRQIASRLLCSLAQSMASARRLLRRQPRS